MTYLGLYALQHRGQESAGIAACGRRTHRRLYRGRWDTSRTSSDEAELARLPGEPAIGHVRYSTAGESELVNAQPILIDCAHGQIAICHNGNLVNAGSCATSWSAQGSIFQTDQRHARSCCTCTRGRRRACRGRHRRVAHRRSRAPSRSRCSRADRLIAVRDPHGFRPLALGRLGDATVVVLRDVRHGPHRRDVRARRRAGRDRRRSAPGASARSSRFRRRRLAHCIFEHVYFARPDSYVFGESVNEVRTEFGRVLAREQPCRPTSSCRCPTRRVRGDRATPRRQGSRCGWA